MNDKVKEKQSYAEYKTQIGIVILQQFQNLSSSEVKTGMDKNEYFIRSCYDLGFSIHHVVHELTI